MSDKYCSGCEQTKDTETDFYKNRSAKDGLQNYCKTCHGKATMAWSGAKEYRQRYRGGKGWKKTLLNQARMRAKKRGHTCTITEDDFDIPKVCPVLGMPLVRNTGHVQHDSATIDRIDSTKGYEPGNVQVMSYLANMMKSNASPEQLLAFADWAHTTYGGL